MKSISKFFILFLMMSLSIMSCREDGDNPLPPQMIEIDVPQVNVNSSILGLIKDQNGVGVVDASISVNGELITQTDENGVFLTNKFQMNNYGTHITASKDGYFLGSTFVQPENEQRVYTEIKLISKVKSGDFTSSAGGTINTTQGAAVNFSANTIKDAADNDYSGTVNVYTHWFDPTSIDLGSEMPGDLRAVNLENEFRQLGTYGMIAVELEDQNGNALNIKDGKTAEITLPVPASLLSNAPSTIPLWHFDETSGYWLEDGEATLVDGKYIGEVSHFSFWNCDIPENFIELSGTLLSSTGNAMDLARIKFTASDATFGYAWVQEDGVFSLKVPKDLELTMEVSDYCNDIIYTEVVGIFSVDSTLPTVTVTANTSTWYEISGKLTNCVGDPLTNGYLKLERPNGGYTIKSPDDQGEVLTSFVNCDGVSELTMIAYDFDDNLVSEEQILVLSGSPLSFATISTCNQSVEYININYNGKLIELIDVSGSEWNLGYRITGFGPDSLSFNFLVENTDLNILNEPFIMGVQIRDNNGDTFGGYCEDCINSAITLSQNATTIGEFYEGYYDVNLLDSWNGVDSLNFTGNFRVEREN